MKINNVSKAILAILICQVAGIVGSVFTTPSIATWYAGLARPVFSPPNWIFAPVWTTLFTLMGISAFLIWRAGLKRCEVKIALAVFVGQLVLNTCWSIIFFGLHSPMFAFFEIIILWSFILASIILFAKISKLAAVLLIPYILWVSFASVLNYFIWRLNF
ncbi:MAG: TspO/MBR family protein [Patescibacteria group bacterium]